MESDKMCGFNKLHPCNEKCKYFETCTRNPNKKEHKTEVKK